MLLNSEVAYSGIWRNGSNCIGCIVLSISKVERECLPRGDLSILGKVFVST